MADITATPDAPAPITDAAFPESIPPIPTTGIRTAEAMAATPSNPIGFPAPGLVAVAKTGPAPRFSERRRWRHCAGGFFRWPGS